MIKDDTPDVDEVVEAAPPIMEVRSNPYFKADKGKGTVAPASLGPPVEQCNDAVVEAVRRFIHQQARRSGSSSATSAVFSVEVPASLDGLNPRFRPDQLAAARVKGYNEDFGRIGVDPRRAFDPVPNIMNS